MEPVFKGAEATMGYADLDFKIPEESDDYTECSEFVVSSIESILKVALAEGQNKIILNTNLKSGLPMENINKIAGPFVEAWAFETFHKVMEDATNEYLLINAEAQGRLEMADILLQFRRQRRIESSITAGVDVKSTSEDIKSSGKSPNITSFMRIRTAYIEDPDYIFIILSLKHRVYSTRNHETHLMDSVMEVVAYNAYDLKYLSSKDFNYNPALGTGQIQVRDIHYVTLQIRTVWDFCQLLDKKFLASSRKTFEEWFDLARKGGWIKLDE